MFCIAKVGQRSLLCTRNQHTSLPGHYRWFPRRLMKIKCIPKRPNVPVAWVLACPNSPALPAVPEPREDKHDHNFRSDSFNKHHLTSRLWFGYGYCKSRVRWGAAKLQTESGMLPLYMDGQAEECELKYLLFLTTISKSLCTYLYTST